MDKLFVPKLQKKEENAPQISNKNVVITGLNGQGKTYYLRTLKKYYDRKNGNSHKLDWKPEMDRKTRYSDDGIRQDPMYNKNQNIEAFLNDIAKHKVESKQVCDFMNLKCVDQERSDSGPESLIWFRNKNDALLEFNDLSAGQKRIFIIFRDWIINNFVNKTKDCQVEFWDEVETSIHPKFQKELIPFLSQNFSDVQFFLTTNSPFVIASAMKDPKWIVLSLKREVDQEDKREWVSFLEFKKENFDRLSQELGELGINTWIWEFALCECTVFVEGESDAKYLNWMLGSDDNSDIHFFPICGVGNEKFFNLFNKWFGKRFIKSSTFVHDGDFKIHRKNKNKDRNYFDINCDGGEKYRCEYGDNDDKHMIECLMLKFLINCCEFKKSDAKEYHTKLKSKGREEIKRSIKNEVKKSRNTQEGKQKFENFFKSLVEAIKKPICYSKN